MDRRTVRRTVAQALFLDKLTPPAYALSGSSSTASTNMSAGTYLYATSYGYTEGESDISPIGSVTLTSSASVALTRIPVADTTRPVYRRILYRTSNGGSIFYKLKTIYDNNPATTTYSDTTADATLVANARLRTMIGDLHTEELNQWIDDVNKDISLQTRCIIKTTTATTVQYQKDYTYPSDAILPFGQNVNITVDDDEMHATTIQNLDFSFPLWRQTTGGSSRWWFTEAVPGTSYSLYPPPDTTNLTIRLHYPAIADTLVDDNDQMLSGFYTHRHNIIVQGVVARYKVKSGDYSSMNLYELQVADFRREIAQNKLNTNLKVYIPKVNVKATTARYDPFFDRS